MLSGNPKLIQNIDLLLSMQRRLRDSFLTMKSESLEVSKIKLSH
jgi:hypothetical protein